MRLRRSFTVTLAAVAATCGLAVPSATASTIASGPTSSTLSKELLTAKQVGAGWSVSRNTTFTALPLGTTPCGKVATKPPKQSGSAARPFQYHGGLPLLGEAILGYGSAPTKTVDEEIALLDHLHSCTVQGKKFTVGTLALSHLGKASGAWSVEGAGEDLALGIVLQGTQALEVAFVNTEPLAKATVTGIIERASKHLPKG